MILVFEIGGSSGTSSQLRPILNVLIWGPHYHPHSPSGLFRHLRHTTARAVVICRASWLQASGVLCEHQSKVEDLLFDRQIVCCQNWRGVNIAVKIHALPFVLWACTPWPVPSGTPHTVETDGEYNSPPQSKSRQWAQRRHSTQGSSSATQITKQQIWDIGRGSAWPPQEFSAFTFIPSFYLSVLLLFIILGIQNIKLLGAGHNLYWVHDPFYFPSLPSTLPTCFRDPSYETLRQEIDQLLLLGAVERVPNQFRGRGFYSKYFLTERKWGWRPVLSLCILNKFILHKQCFKMVTLTTIIPALDEEDWFAAYFPRCHTP